MLFNPAFRGLGLAAANGGGWQTVAGGVPSTFEIDFVNNRATGGSISSLLTCTRASPGYYGNVDGTLTKFGDAARTNLLTQSQNFATDWTGHSLLNTGTDTTTAPDGSLTADTIGNIANGDDFYYIYQTPSLLNGTTYTLSMYVKNKTGLGKFWLLGEGNGNLFVFFNITTGLVEQATGVGVVSSFIQSVGNGWYRCGFTFTKSSADAAEQIGIGLYDTVNVGDTNPGAANSQELYVWGAQLEAASAWNQSGVTAYIPTTTVAVTAPAVDNVLRYGSNGLLVEEARTNLATYSQDTTFNSPWASGDATSTDFAAAAPDGTLTACKFTEHAVASSGFYLENVIAGALSNATAYTGSVYIKPNGRTSIRFHMHNSTAYLAAYIFDLTGAGSLTRLTGASDSASVTPLANGWYRITVTGTTASTHSMNEYLISPQVAGSNAYTGDGVSGFYVWGAQFEAGSFATSYIPTLAASVTRAAETVSFARSSTSLSGTTESAYVAFSLPDYSNSPVLLAGSGAAAAWAVVGTTGTFSANDGTHSATTSNTAPTNTISKGATGFDPTGATVCLNGGTVNTGATVVMPAVATYYLGTLATFGEAINGYIRRAAWWNTRLSNANLQAITSTSAIDLFNADNLDIDFVNDAASTMAFGVRTSTSIAALLTCTRASSGYYTNVAGVLSSFGSNVLRYGDNGLLVEEARTNLALQSQAFDNAAWTAAQTSVSANVVTAPDGTLTADKLVENNTTNLHYITAASSISISNTTAYTFSVYLKAAERTFAAVQGDASSGLLGGVAAINLTTGAVVNNATGGTVSVETLANGWFRVKITTTSSGTTASPGVGLRATSGSGFESYAGDGVSGFYVWGAQLEAGDFATSYIPTTSGSATRAADDVKTANISWLTAGTGVLYEEALSFAASSGGVGVFSLNNASTNNRIDMRTDAESIITAGGVSQAELDMAGGSVANVSSKYAIAYATNDFAGCFNGGTVATDGSGTPPTTITQFQFGALDGGTSNLLNGNIQRLTYWNTRLADIHLQAITA